jgi:transposase
LQWDDAPKGYGPHKTLYDRFIRWSELGVFDCIFASLAGGGPKPERIMYSALPEAGTLIADKGYDSDELRDALEAKGIDPCIPPKRKRRRAIPFDKALYKQRHKIENMFGRLKDWRRVSTRYDRCAHTFFPAICIAATVIFWL